MFGCMDRSIIELLALGDSKNESRHFFHNSTTFSAHFAKTDHSSQAPTEPCQYECISERPQFQSSALELGTEIGGRHFRFVSACNVGHSSHNVHHRRVEPLLQFTRKVGAKVKGSRSRQEAVIFHGKNTKALSTGDWGKPAQQIVNLSLFGITDSKQKYCG